MSGFLVFRMLDAAFGQLDSLIFCVGKLDLVWFLDLEDLLLEIGFGLVFLDMLLFRSTIQRYLASCLYTRAKQPFYWCSVITLNPVNLREESIVDLRYFFEFRGNVACFMHESLINHPLVIVNFTKVPAAVVMKNTYHHIIFFQFIF